MQNKMLSGSLKQNWEKLFCLGVILGILIAAAAGVSHWLKEKSGGENSREVIPVVPKFLNLEHLNLFDKKNGIDVPKNPMAFKKKNAMAFSKNGGRPVRKKTPQPKVPAKAKTVAGTPAVAKKAPAVRKQVAAVRKQTPAVKSAKSVPPPPPKKAPVRPPRVITVIYTGLYQGLKKQNAAFVEVHDSREKRTYPAVVTSGERIADTLQVKEIAADGLILQRPGGKQEKLRRDQVWKVEIHE